LVPELYEEERISLKVFLKTCQENGIELIKSFSDRFILRLCPELLWLLPPRGRA
jgi:predicted HicB family RNase H-like nuclease